ncbi:type VI secretion system-associated FHA domain protein TagH [Glaciecola sp. 33A]|jgi:type VI secretion system protein|uniref:type VI secretion system-associated FHA domain protein TagH n=1 Tax=Glaciecola sp. 33A TaxID=2057807 RepID=UPI000C345D4F|nr:type VI secretion system-associated FHA domain protein TagH [Glaciecola sp. 33A]PKI02973.1 type VI secretion system-associated FHA domain protein TagH [Glaciecola sp. 33A]
MSYLKLKLLSATVIGQNDECSFTDLGGSIGRAPDCDWTLIDTDRFVSKKHLLISFRNQQFILTDVSSNGAVINNANAPLGHGNEHVLQKSDVLVIGKHSVQVEEINLQYTEDSTAQLTDNQTDGDLLGLVMGAEAAAPLEANPSSFFTPSGPQNFGHNASPSGDLGLKELLSEPLISPAASTPQIPSNQFNPSAQTNSPFSTASDSVVKVGDGVIPDDWEMFDVGDLKPANDTQQPAPQQEIANPFAEELEKPIFEPLTPTSAGSEWLTPTPSQDINNQGAQVLAPTVAPAPAPDVYDSKNERPVIPPSVTADIPQQNNTNQGVSEKVSLAVSGDDTFFCMLYEKLGLPKEFMSTVDKETFAEDVATVMLSTTKGVMSLLASRTAFKQESRLSATLIQPRSNNPIKFSIDPEDTLEMLLVKKKKGYMTTGDAYDEALKDIQLHQMAFMAGLQGTLIGLLAELAPETIEKQVNEKSKRFMGLNANSQCWQLYKEKQSTLAKSVTENLNEILGSYFSDAYQSQINNFKNEQ